MILGLPLIWYFLRSLVVVTLGLSAADQLSASPQGPISVDTTQSTGVTPSASTLEQETTLRVGETFVVAERGLKRIALGNGKILSAKRLERDQVLLMALQPGSTSLHLWYHDGTERRVLVQVHSGDEEQLLKDVRLWLGKSTHIETRVIGGKVVLEGRARNVQEAQKVKELAQRSPLIMNLVQQAGVEQMIAMEVRFLEVKKSALENIGVNWQKSTAGPLFGVVGDMRTNSRFRPASSGSIDASGAPNLTSNLPGTTSEPLLGKVSPFAMYFGLQSTLASAINLMEQKGDAIVLAEPILSCRSGGAARFLAGGEIPLPTTSPLGATSVQFKPYGIKFEISPTLTESGSISARVMTELSTLDPAIKVGDLPAFLSRQTETEVNLNEGETLVISGLISEDKSKTLDKMPGLGNIPVLGKLFSSRDFRERRSEMVVFVTPRFISPNSELNRSLTDRATHSLDQTKQRLTKRGENE
ncbi:MAG: pilus assembly protein N-terminal domain-containing protein [Betaproteobacteria bacterium]|nr:pilus assembly protein N-terminal domain-containing protein [Betaproteobacteria bacterium]